MSPRKTLLRGFGFLAISFVTLSALFSPIEAQAVTFGEWANGKGWPAAKVMPEQVHACSTSIDSLAGVENYNWTQTWGLWLNDNHITSVGTGSFMALDKLLVLDLSHNQIARVESGDFAGLNRLRSLELHHNQVASIDSAAFVGLNQLERLSLDYNGITSIESGDFAGLDRLTQLSLENNQITNIESGDFSGLGQLTQLCLYHNQITNIEPGAFAELSRLEDLYLSDNTTLTELNLEEGDFSSLCHFDLMGDVAITRVSLRNSELTQRSLTALTSGGTIFTGLSGYLDYLDAGTGIGELPGVTELDLSGVDFGPITDLSPLYSMDHLTDLWLVGTRNIDANQVDVLLDNLDAMQNPAVEGTLYLTRADYDALNAAGGGRLARWDAEAGHHVQIVPEPGTILLIATLFLSLACRTGIRRFA